MGEIILVLVFLGIAVLLVALMVRYYKRRSNLSSQGYEFLIGNFYRKDGMIFFLQNKIPTPVEVVGVAEVTQNATLVALDIRFRLNGSIRVVRVKGGSNYLLNVEDKLGYGG